MLVFILVQPMEVNDEVPMEADFDLAVQGLRAGRAGGPSEIRAEYLKGWRKEANQERGLVGRRWDLVLRIVQVMFRDRAVPVEISRSKMVLILKGKGGYKGIGLVKLLWKVCAVVVNFCLKSSAVIHDAFHGFR